MKNFDRLLNALKCVNREADKTKSFTIFGVTKNMSIIRLGYVRGGILTLTINLASKLNLENVYSLETTGLAAERVDTLKLDFLKGKL